MPAAGLPLRLVSALVGLGAQLDPGHVPQADGGAVGVDAQGDVLELLRGLQHVLDVHGHVQLLALDGGQAAGLAGGDLGVVGPHGLSDVVGGEVDS